MKIVAISDTHGQHEKLLLPKGDVIIHAGDICRRSTRDETLNFLTWFDGLDFKYKIFIPGNHDFFFERNDRKEIENIIPWGVTYLNDSGCEINGVKFWGSPITPWFYDWAFNRQRGADICKHWDLIPKDIDVLITHGPVRSMHDVTRRGDIVGCEDLLRYVSNIRPKAHVCGHIHEGYGQKEMAGIKFINVSVLNERYELVNEPILLEI